MLTIVSCLKNLYDYLSYGDDYTKFLTLLPFLIVLFFVLCYHIFMKGLKDIINILIVSLDDKFSKLVSETLSSQLEMFNADCRDLIIYDLVNPKEILEKCGFEYLKKRELGVIKSTSSYQNTVISISYDLYKEYSLLFSHSLIVYLRLPKEKVRGVANSISYQSRDEFLASNNDIELYFERKSKLNATKQIIEKLGELK